MAVQLGKCKKNGKKGKVCYPFTASLAARMWPMFFELGRKNIRTLHTFFPASVPIRFRCSQRKCGHSNFWFTAPLLLVPYWFCRYHFPGRFSSIDNFSISFFFFFVALRRFFPHSGLLSVPKRFECPMAISEGLDAAYLVALAWLSKTRVYVLE